MTSGYLETYGETIQGCRIKDQDADALNEYFMKSSGLHDGMKIIDAGCGVCGPALYFAENLDIHIEAITNSSVQQEIAEERIRTADLSYKINVTKGDYHNLDNYYRIGGFDQILFLESLGHARDIFLVIRSAYDVLRSGGYIFIKDYFPLYYYRGKDKTRLKKVIRNLNKSFCYNTLDLNHCLTALRQTGFEIIFIRKPDYPIDFEVSYTFEDKFNIDVWQGKDHFKVAEWLEIKCRKI